MADNICWQIAKFDRKKGVRIFGLSRWKDGVIMFCDGGNCRMSRLAAEAGNQYHSPGHAEFEVSVKTSRWKWNRQLGVVWAGDEMRESSAL